jgi:hypothetical protein
MQKILVPKLGAQESPDLPPFSWAKSSPQFSSWESVRAWARKKVAEEQIWEPLFVCAALATWGWYVLCLYQAFLDYAIVPLP